MSAVALHEAEIRAHVERAKEGLTNRLQAHLMISKCGGNIGCSYCQLWASSWAQISRVLDFLEVEIPKR